MVGGTHATDGTAPYATTLRAALNAGLMAGLLHGLADGVVAGLRTRPPGAGAWIGCLAGSVLVYGAVWAVVLIALSPGLHLLLRRRRGGLHGRFAALLGLALGLACFLELYWWTRPFVFYGRSALDPRRLAAAGGCLLLGLSLGLALTRLGRVIPHGVKLAATVLVPLCWLGGGAWLAVQNGAGVERGLLNERNRDLPNVLLIVVDALRADVIGAYGAEAVRTPVIDALAERGVLFENAIVQAPYTWASFGSFLTGKYPRRHGLVKMAPGVKMRANVTLPWHLKSAPLAAGGRLAEDDYLGATFMTGTLSHGSGLDRGFDVYYEALVGHELVDLDRPWSEFRSELLLSIVRNKLLQRLDANRVASVAVEWLREHGRKRFVAMVHLYSTHTPYDPPQEYRELYCDPAYTGPLTAFYAEHRLAIEAGGVGQLTPADRRQIRDLYWAGVTQADAMIGEVLAELERQDVLHRTLVIVTSDHGEELGEHDVWEHDWMWQTNLRIPLVMALPGRLPAGARVAALVESVDVLPTVCSLVGVAPPPRDAEDPYERIDGFDLWPLVRGEAQGVREHAFSENGPFMAVQDARWKLIVGRRSVDPAGWEAALAGEPLGRPRLFDLALDPGETRNVVLEQRAQAERLVAALRAWDASMPIPRWDVLVSARDQERLLRELGYTDGAGQDFPDDE
jgi:arylsulfatase A-like enzyme